MALEVSVRIEGTEQFRQVLERATPSLNPRIVSGAFVGMMTKILRNAAEKQIVQGRGKAPPLPRRLSGRTNTLVRSLGPAFGLDRSGLPFSISGGTDLVYGRIHELGLGRYPKRAFLEPAVEEEIQNLEDILAKHWQRAFE